jgi:hypothetical protein
MQRAVRLGADLIYDRRQPSSILFVREEKDHNGVRQLPGADPSDIGVTGPGVDQHIVNLEDLLPLFLQVLKEKKAILMIIKVPPIDAPKAQVIGTILCARRHNQEPPRIPANSARLINILADIGHDSGT